MLKQLLTVVFLLSAGTLWAQQAAGLLPVQEDTHCKEWVEQTLSRMKLKDKVGQLFVYTLAPRADKDTEKLVGKLTRKFKVGAFLYSEGTVEDQANLTNYAQRQSKIPLMITFDGEWGLAMRLENTPVFPRNAALGCISDNTLIEAYGEEVARELREIGAHVNFAPDADVNTNPENPVIHVRSFGENPKTVAEKVIAYGRGLETGGILSVSKHFPGHGDTDVDSHQALPAVYYNRARLDSVELYPFKEAIQAGLGGVMVGHLQVPALEPDRITPSSLSHSIVTDLLRGELGFNGLVFTDALAMKGVAAESDVTVKALKVGNDMVLVQQNVEKAQESVVQAIKDGRLTMEEIDAKCRRILAYKYRLGLSRRPMIPVDGLSDRIHTPEAQALVTKLRTSAVTVLGNYFQILPLTATKGEIAVLTVGDEGSDASFIEGLRSELPLKTFRMDKNTGEEERRKIVKELGNYRRVVVSITVQDKEAGEYRSFFAGFRPQAPVVYAFFTSYRALASLEEAAARSAAVVLAHSGEEDLQRYVADVVLGKASATGRLSMRIGNTFAAGSGVDVISGSPAGIAPEDYGLKSYRLHRIDSVVTAGLAAKAFPGCQVLVLRHGQPVYDKCFGTHSVTDTTPVRATDLFDLASLTKTSATLLAVMKLYDQGRIELTDAVSKYVPALRATNKKNITIRELLLHESGLVPYIRFYRDAIDEYSVTGPFTQGFVDEWHHTRMGEYTYACSDFKFKKGLVSATKTSGHTLQIADGLWLDKKFKAAMMKSIAQSELDRKRFVYSDIGFILLQQVVEAVTGKTLDAYLVSEFYRPMGLEHTLFQPLNRYKKADIMPTAANDYLRRQDLCGYVHDEAAAFMGGVSGNAGLFSTAQELGKIYQMILNEGELDGKRYLWPETCRIFTTEKSAVSHRGLGYDKPNLKDPKANACASSAPASVYGHTGFTGTCAWVDPENDLVYIFLSNRLCPDAWNGKLNSMKIRQAIQEVIYQSLYTPE